MDKKGNSYSISNIEIGKIVEDLSLAYNTVSPAVNRFEKLGILHLVKKKKMNKIFSYKEYIDILKME